MGAGCRLWGEDSLQFYYWNHRPFDPNPVWTWNTFRQGKKNVFVQFKIQVFPAWNSHVLSCKCVWSCVCVWGGGLWSPQGLWKCSHIPQVTGRRNHTNATEHTCELEEQRCVSSWWRETQKKMLSGRTLQRLLDAWTRLHANSSAGWGLRLQHLTGWCDHSQVVFKVTASAEGLLLQEFIHNLLQCSSLYEMMSAPGKGRIYSDFII